MSLSHRFILCFYRLEMYCGNVTKVFIFNQRNSSLLQTRGKHLIENGAFENKYKDKLFRLCTFFVRNITPAFKYNAQSRSLKFMYGQNTTIRYLKQELLKIPMSLKTHSVHIVRTCAQQCECVVAHRIRRGQQIFSLYTRLWDEVALKEMVFRMRQQLCRKGKEMLWGAVVFGASVNWEKITDDEINSCTDHLEAAISLKTNTVTCSKCHQRQVIDAAVPNVVYCRCPDGQPSCEKMCTGMEWIPFIEREDLIVWRKDDNGMYSYKVYGKYHDVIAEDFLHVQIDTEFRKKWDTTALELEILETDPDSNSDILYWEMEWPRLFSNRDYVFNRRYSIDMEQKVIVLMNKCMEHPDRPIRKENHRVTDYYSCMVIRSVNDFSEPGIEFTLTYFEDPGTSIPSPLTSWVAKSALPDFLGRIRLAARELAERRNISERSAHMIKQSEICTEVPTAHFSTGGPKKDKTPGSGLESGHDGEGNGSGEESEPKLPCDSKEFNFSDDVRPRSKKDKKSVPEDHPQSVDSESPKQEGNGDGSCGINPKPSVVEYSGEDLKPPEGQPKTSLYFNSFPYQDPSDLYYLHFHASNLFT